MQKEWLYKYVTGSIVTLKKNWLISVPFILFSLLTVSSLLVPSHVVRNLEPYPDSFFYLVPPYSFTENLSWSYQREGYVIPLRVAPLYSLLLTVVFFIWHSPIAFVLLNIALGLLGLFSLLKIIERYIENSVIKVLLMLLYLGHATLIWLVGLPMTENLVLTLVMILTWQLLVTTVDFKKVVIFNTLVTCLFLTKYSLSLVAAAYFVAYLLKLVELRQYKFIKVSILIQLGAAVIWILLQVTGDSNIFKTLFTTVPDKPDVRGLSGSYVLNNIRYYVTALMGKRELFLWLPVSLTILPVTLLGVVGYLFAKIPAPVRKGMLAVIAAHLMLPIIYYSTDLRYISSIIPLFIVGIALFIHSQMRRYPKVVIYLAVILLLLFQGISQATIVKKIIAENMFGKSTAWQYQAIQVINSTLPNQSVFVTALPPFLFDLYTDKPIMLLPLSQQQEFVNKKQHVWGDLDYGDIYSEVLERLKNGASVYISNAYITHQQQVIDDFEEYKKHFNLVLVAEGCQQACNIYRLELKPEP